MQTQQDRRRFLRTSLAAGAVLTLAGAELPQQSGAAAAPDRSGPVNPRVRPGRVRWHRDFAAARAAASRSGKPVLLFHMMGRLDEKFC
jgi:hypothetical protein